MFSYVNILGGAIKEMVINIPFSSSICATAFIIYFLYTLLFGFSLFENDCLLLLTSSGLIAKCPNKPKLSRLTQQEQKQYIIPFPAS